MFPLLEIRWEIFNWHNLLHILNSSQTATLEWGFHFEEQKIITKTQENNGHIVPQKDSIWQITHWLNNTALYSCSVFMIHLNKHTCNDPKSISWIRVLRDKHEMNIFIGIQYQHWSVNFQSGLPAWKEKSISLLSRWYLIVRLCCCNLSSGECEVSPPFCYHSKEVCLV